MDNPKPNNRLHPLVAGAAVAVTLASLVGVAAMTGLFPSSQGSNPAQMAAMSTAPGDYNNQQQQQQPGQPVQNGAQSYGQNGAQSYGQTGAQPYAQNGSYAQAPVQQQAPRPAYAAAPRPQEQAPQQQAICRSCGRVESIQAIQHAAPPSGVGIAAGALLGGVLGHQVGHGNGNTLATVAGAVGGGFAGNEVEKRTRTNTTYQVVVRMEDGKVRTFPQSGQGWRVGDPVRVVNGHLEGRG